MIHYISQLNKTGILLGCRFCGAILALIILSGCKASNAFPAPESWHLQLAEVHRLASNVDVQSKLEKIVASPAPGSKDHNSLEITFTFVCPREQRFLIRLDRQGFRPPAPQEVDGKCDRPEVNPGQSRGDEISLYYQNILKIGPREALEITRYEADKFASSYQLREQMSPIVSLEMDREIKEDFATEAVWKIIYFYKDNQQNNPELELWVDSQTGKVIEQRIFENG